VLGHSMGGCIALEYALRYQHELAGLVLSAPVAALEAASPVTRAVGNLLSMVAPRTPVFAIDPGLVSRDREVVRDYEQDPLNYHGRLPARTVAELSRAVDSFPDRVPTLRLPLLVMHGTADDLVPIAGSEMIAARAGSEDKTFTRYDGLYHEILNEPERDRVVAEIASWLDERSRGLAPATPQAESSSGPEAPTGSTQ
jgi:acylglycerol lipase